MLEQWAYLNLKEDNMAGKLLIPIKNILTGRANIQQIEEFEFIRNNPVISTLGAAALGGAAVHDFHKNGYNSIGKYIGDKIDSVKTGISTGFDKVKETVNHATESTKSESPLSQPEHHIDPSSLT